LKIKNVTKEITYYVELDEDVDDPEFLWYRTDPDHQNWEVLIGDSWEIIFLYEKNKLREMLREYMNK
jgi:hypothetical protein